MKRDQIDRILVFLPGASIPDNIYAEDHIICADSGAIPVLDNGIVPDLIIGDMDSIDSSHLEKSRELGVPIREYPSDKEMSDGELTLREAIQLSPRSMIIFGGKKGRSDHILSNFQMLNIVPPLIDTYLDLEGDRIYLVREGENREVYTDRFDIVSILPSLGKALVELDGLRYQLNGRTLEFGSTLGIHNEPISNEISARSIEGHFYLILSNEGQ